MYSIPYLFPKTLKIRIYELKLFKLQQFRYFAMWFFINVINDDALVSAVMANACFMVHLVWLFMKTHQKTLLQDSCLDLVRCAFLRKLSRCVRNIIAFGQHLLNQLAVLANTDISMKLKYQPGWYIVLSPAEYIINHITFEISQWKWSFTWTWN